MTAVVATAGPGASEARRAEMAAVGRELAAVGLAAEPEARAVRLVWADEVDALLAAVPEVDRESWLDRTILVNEAREQVLDLLEANLLLGAIEYEEVAEWSAAERPRMFASRDVIQKSGERIGGPGRESPHYTLWTDPEAGSLAALVARYAALLPAFDAELVVGADEARAMGLPPLELRVRLGGTGLRRADAIRSAGRYLALHGMPGGFVGFSAAPAPAEERGPGGFAASVKRLTSGGSGEIQLVSTSDQVLLDGVRREAACFYRQMPSPPMRLATCLVRIEHPGGALLASFTRGLPAGQPVSCAAVMADADLRRLARSLRVIASEGGA